MTADGCDLSTSGEIGWLDAFFAACMGHVWTLHSYCFLFAKCLYTVSIEFETWSSTVCAGFADGAVKASRQSSTREYGITP